MYEKEIDCGAWGWYFDDDRKLSENVREFLRLFILVSFQYGVNVSTFGISKGLTDIRDIDQIVEDILQNIDCFEGHQLQKAINYNYYSSKLSSRVLPSVNFGKDEQNIVKYVYYDFFSTFFCTLKKGKLYSIFYNLRSSLFTREDQTEELIYANITRFNSYIKGLHNLMKEFDVSLFDCTRHEINPLFKLSKAGFFLYEDECLFYEDVKELLPTEVKYTEF